MFHQQFGRATFLSLMGCAVLCTMQSGCSTETGGHEVPETLVEVTGTVKLDGEPLQGATLNFVPKTGTGGLGAYAVTDESGKFTATHFSGEPGVEPGDYDVTFSKLAMPDGSPIPEGKDAADVGATEVLPAHLRQVHPEMHKYILTVTSDAQSVDYELNSKR